MNGCLKAGVLTAVFIFSIVSTHASDVPGAFAPERLERAAQFRAPTAMPSAEIAFPAPSEPFQVKNQQGSRLVGDFRATSEAGMSELQMSRLAWLPVDGGMVAHFRVRSVGAKGMRVAFARRGAGEVELRFREIDTGRILGPVDLLQGTRTWGPVTFGDAVDVEAYAPPGAASDILAVDGISHFFEGLGTKAVGDAAPCQQDVSCHVLPESMRNSATATARIVYTRANGQSFTSTGVLLNSDPYSAIPYFIVSSGSIADAAEAATLNTFWFYEATSCGSGTLGAFNQLTGGASLLARSDELRYSFVRLNNAPPSRAYFSGWSPSTPPIGAPVVGVHHPRGDLKKLNLGTVESTGNMLRVRFTSGFLEASSLGSPVHINDQHVAGIAWGWDTGACGASPGRTDYAPFSAIYDEIRQYIRPQILAQGNYSDIWFTPSQPGWGITIADHESQLFAVWYTYGSDGRPTWYVMPGGTFTEGRRLFSAEMYATSGPVYSSAPFNPNLVTSQLVGSARFDFAPPGLAAGSATFTYTLNGATQTKQIHRQPFGDAAPSWKNDRTDIWWSPEESGWGMTLAQHGNNIFGVLFTYGADNRPSWYVMPGVSFEGSRWFRGSLYATTGPSHLGPFDPARVQARLAGSASFSFGGDSGIFAHTIDGSTTARALQRQSFGNSNPPTCSTGMQGICISSLSASSASPMSVLAITGEGFRPDRRGLSVRFAPQSGAIPIVVPIAHASPTRLEVIVPPLFAASDVMTSGSVEVQVLQYEGNILAVSNARALSIIALQPRTSSPGARTAALLRVALSQARALEPRAAARSGQLATALRNYTSRASRVLAALDSRTSTGATLPLENGSSAVLDSARLGVADAMSDALITQLYERLPVDFKESSEKLIEGCPVSEFDPVAQDRALCRLERAVMNIGSLHPEVVREFGKILLGYGIGAAAGGIGLAGQLAVAGVAPFLISGAFDRSMPEFSDVVGNVNSTFGEAMADRTERLRGLADATAGLGILYDTVGLFATAARIFPPSPIVLSHSMVIDDGRGNSYLLASNGMQLARVPTLPGRYDTTQLVVSNCSISYSEWGACQPNNTQSRIVTARNPPGCTGTAVLTQPCTYQGTPCTYVYTAFGACQPNNTRTRTVISSSPPGCTGTPVLTESCAYVPPSGVAGTWAGNWTQRFGGFGTGTWNLRWTLSQSGNSVTGTFTRTLSNCDGLCPDAVGYSESGSLVNGSLSGASLTIFTSGGTSFNGTLSGNTIAGTSGGSFPGNFSLTRQ